MNGINELRGEIQNISCDDIRGEEGQKVIDKLFTAMKEKYSLSPR